MGSFSSVRVQAERKKQNAKRTKAACLPIAIGRQSRCLSGTIGQELTVDKLATGNRTLVTASVSNGHRAAADKKNPLTKLNFVPFKNFFMINGDYILSEIYISSSFAVGGQSGQWFRAFFSGFLI